MIVRGLVERDIPRINELHEKYHKDTAYFPHLSTVLAHGVVCEDSEILAYGALAISGEAVMMLDVGIPAIKKGRVIRLLVGKVKEEAEKRRLDKVVILSENPRLLTHLRDVYKMREMKALILEIDNG